MKIRMNHEHASADPLSSSGRPTSGRFALGKPADLVRASKTHRDRRAEALADVFIDQFIAAFETPPLQLTSICDGR